MSALGKILAYLGIVVLVGALLAPPLYWAGQWGIDLIPQLAGIPFHRYFNRAVMVVAVLGVVPLLAWLGIRRWADLGLEPNARRWRDLGLGVGLAVGGLWLTAAAILASGRAVFDDELDAASIAPRVVGALATGVVVGVIEETFFRGALFGVLRRRLAWPWALGALSLVFGAVHFIRPERGAAEPDPVTWASGLAWLPHALARFSEPSEIVASLATLVLMGWVLGYTVVRTRSLFLAIGLHAGWVFALRVFTTTTHRVGEPDLWLGDSLRSGLAPLALMAVTLAALAWLLRDRGPRL